ncbi:MAG: hypothetical protein ACR2P0_19450 [Acidimicrobiales bacterium]
MAGSLEDDMFEAAPVVVPVRRPSHIVHTLPTAIWLARTLGTTIDVLTVLDPDDDRSFEERELTAALADATRGADVGVDFRVIVAESVADGFVAHCSGRLVCMTTSADPFDHGHYVGSHAAALLEVSDAPVVLVGPSADADCIEHVTDIVVAISSDSDSKSILPHARWMAGACGVPMSTVRIDVEAGTVYESHYEAAGLGPPDSIRATLRSTPVEAGDISSSLVDRSNTAILAVATHARRGLVWLAEGSVAFDSIAKATTPVLAVGPNVRLV